MPYARSCHVGLWFQMLWRRRPRLPRRHSCRRMVRYSKEQVTSNIAASHRRRLPHEYPPGKALFLTWHLHGGLPSSLYPPLGKRSSGEIFVSMDRYLDTTRLGTMFLKHEAVARCVVKAIQRGADELGQYELDAYVVMSNHVHMLAQPRTAPNWFMKSLKGFTTREANRILARTGQPFWQAEFRPLGAKQRRTRANTDLHRREPCQGRLSAVRRRLSLVKCISWGRWVSDIFSPTRVLACR